MDTPHIFSTSHLRPGRQLLYRQAASDAAKVLLQGIHARHVSLTSFTLNNFFGTHQENYQCLYGTANISTGRVEVLFEPFQTWWCIIINLQISTAGCRTSIKHSACPGYRVRRTTSPGAGCPRCTARRAAPNLPPQPYSALTPTVVGDPLRRVHGARRVGLQRQRELYDEAHQALRVEYELVPRRVLVAYERVEPLHLRPRRNTFTETFFNIITQL